MTNALFITKSRRCLREGHPVLGDVERSFSPHPTRTLGPAISYSVHTSSGGCKSYQPRPGPSPHALVNGTRDPLVDQPRARSIATMRIRMVPRP